MYEYIFVHLFAWLINEIQSKRKESTDNHFYSLQYLGILVLTAFDGERGLNQPVSIELFGIEQALTPNHWTFPLPLVDLLVII